MKSRSALFLVCFMALTVHSSATAVPIPSGKPHLPEPLRKLPASVGMFVHVRAGDVWDLPRAKLLRSALGEAFDDLLDEVGFFGVPPEEIERFTYLVMPPSADRTHEVAGRIFTTREPVDRAAVLLAWSHIADGQGDEPIPDVVEVPNYPPVLIRFSSPRTFSVFDAGFDEEYQAAEPIPANGREPEAVRAAVETGNLAVWWLEPMRFRERFEHDLRINWRLRDFPALAKSRSALFTFR